MRTAGLMPPCVETLPTPDTSLSRCASSIWRDPLRFRTDTEYCEVSASVTIGVSGDHLE